MFVHRRMRKDVVTVNKDETLIDAKNKMKRHNVSQLPVMDGDKVVGLIAKRDIHSATLPLILLEEKEKGKTRKILETSPVSKVMTRNPVVINMYDTLEDAVIMLHDYRISSLPVLSDEDKLVGIITKTDVLGAFIEALGVKEISQRLEVVVDDKPGALAEVVNTIKKFNTNLISVMTTPHPDGGKRIVYLRVATLNVLPIKEALKNKGIEIHEPWNPPRC